MSSKKWRFSPIELRIPNQGIAVECRNVHEIFIQVIQEKLLINTVQQWIY